MEEQFKLMNKVGELYYRFKGGENGADVFNRACLFTEHLFREIESIEYKRRDNIIIVTHDLFIRLFMLNFLNSDLDKEKLNSIRHPNNCEFWIIEKNEKGRFKIKSDIFVAQKDVPLSLTNNNSTQNFLKKRKSIVDLEHEFSEDDNFLHELDVSDYDSGENDSNSKENSSGGEGEKGEEGEEEGKEGKEEREGGKEGENSGKIKEE